MGFFGQHASSGSLASATPSNLSRSSTLSSDTVGTSASSVSSQLPVPSSSSSSSLRAFFASPKDYFAPSVVYPTSALDLRRGKSVREAKQAARDLAAARHSAELARPAPGRAHTPQARCPPPAVRKRANSAAALVPPLWVAPSPRDNRLVDDGFSVGRHSRRGSAEDSVGIAYVTFVREHRHSRSATPTDGDRRNPRRPPSPKLASGKVLSPLPELGGKPGMQAAMDAARRSPTKMMRSPHKPTVDLLEEAIESDEEGFPPVCPKRPLRLACGAENESSVPLNSGCSTDGKSASSRPLQGRRSILRTHTDSALAAAASASSVCHSPQSASIRRLELPSTPSKEDERSLPPLPSTTVFRPKSRRTLSLPFAPHLSNTHRTPADGPMLPPACPPPRQKSPFAAPASVLKAPTVSTSVSTSPSLASLSTFSSWDFPTAADADSLVGRHRVLTHLGSYALPQPTRSDAESGPSSARTRMASSPSTSSTHRSSPASARLRMDRSHTQPLVSSRLSQAASSPASSLGTQPTPLKRASTIAHCLHGSHAGYQGRSKPLRDPKLRLPPPYSAREFQSGQLSPSGSTEALSLVRTRSTDRRTSMSSTASSAHESGCRFSTPKLPSNASASSTTGGMLRSSSGVSLAGLISFARRPSIKDAELLKAQQDELARKAAVAAALKAEEDDSDDEPFITFRDM